MQATKSLANGTEKQTDWNTSDWKRANRTVRNLRQRIFRKTHQVVAYAIGKRSKKTCQRLWEAIPQAYRQGHCFTDFLNIYAYVIPAEQHSAVGKETGETAHVERWNNTLRQRLARFVRMALSFSTSEVMHEACLLLFLHRYNLDRAILLT